MHPEQFWYTSGAEVELPFNIMGLVAFELFAMHFVEVRWGWWWWVCIMRPCWLRYLFERVVHADTRSSGRTLSRGVPLPR